MFMPASGKNTDGRKRLEKHLGIFNASLAENRPSLHWVVSPVSKPEASPLFKSHKVNKIVDRSENGVVDLAQKQFVENKRFLAEGVSHVLPSSPNNFFMLSRQSKLKGVCKQNAKIKSQMLLKIDLPVAQPQQNSTSSIIFDVAKHTKRLLEKSKHKAKLATFVSHWSRVVDSTAEVFSPERALDNVRLDIQNAHHRNFSDFRFSNTKKVKLIGGNSFQNEFVRRLPKGGSSFTWGSHVVQRKVADVQELTVQFLKKFAVEKRAVGPFRRRMGSYCRQIPVIKTQPSIRQSSLTGPVQPRVWIWLIEKLLEEKNLKKVG